MKQHKKMRKVLNDENRCTGCGLCAEICPKSCILMEESNDGFLYPKINTDVCINCGLCNKRCPVTNRPPVIKPLGAVGYIDKDVTFLKKSASGGIASRFAKIAISNNGGYSGVRFNENLTAIHDLTTDIKTLDLYRDSKYVQSETNHIFNKIKNYLETNNNILVVTGTPCQIAAISSYFNKKIYDNLILVELICNGFPSPSVFKAYLKQIEKQENKRIKQFYFRDKTLGWHTSNVRVIFDDGGEKIIPRKDSCFFDLFGSNMILRESCYDCQFREFHSSADIIIGDYWGIEKYDVDFAKDDGCSVVIFNTQKGKTFFDMAKDYGKVINTGLDFAIKTHSKLMKSVSRNRLKDWFFEDFHSKGLKKSADLYCCKGSIIKRIRRKFIIIYKQRRKQND